MGAKGSVEAAKMNADNWGHLEVCIFHVVYNLQLSRPLFCTLPLSFTHGYKNVNALFSLLHTK